MIAAYSCARMILLALCLGFSSYSAEAIAQDGSDGTAKMPSLEPTQPAGEGFPTPSPNPSEENPLIVPTLSPPPNAVGTGGGGDLALPPPFHHLPMNTPDDVAGIDNIPFPAAPEPSGTPVVGGGMCLFPATCGCRSNDPIYTTENGTCIPPQGSCRNNSGTYQTITHHVCEVVDSACELVVTETVVDCSFLPSTIDPAQCANGGTVTLKDATSCDWRNVPGTAEPRCMATASVAVNINVTTCAPTLYPRGRAGVRLSKGSCSKDPQFRCVGQCRLDYLEPSAPEDVERRCVAVDFPHGPATDVLPEATCSCGA